MQRFSFWASTSCFVCKFTQHIVDLNITFFVTFSAVYRIMGRNNQKSMLLFMLRNWIDDVRRPGIFTTMRLSYSFFFLAQWGSMVWNTWLNASHLHVVSLLSNMTRAHTHVALKHRIHHTNTRSSVKMQLFIFSCWSTEISVTLKRHLSTAFLCSSLQTDLTSFSHTRQFLSKCQCLCEQKVTSTSANKWFLYSWTFIKKKKIVARKMSAPSNLIIFYILRLLHNETSQHSNSHNSDF